jgi:hypothetical protein
METLSTPQYAKLSTSKEANGQRSGVAKSVILEILSADESLAELNQLCFKYELKIVKLY